MGGYTVLMCLQISENAEDQNRFQMLYERYRGLMFWRAMQILQNENDAEDAVQQAFLSILEHFEKVSSVDCPKTRAYVVIIAESKAIDLLRIRKHLAYDVELETLPGPEIMITDGSELAQAMARLPARYRQVLLLRYDIGYSTRELAKLFSMTEMTTQKLLWRAKRALENELQEVRKNGR